MLKDWQFNVLFVVGVSGAILMLLGPEVGLDIGKNPTAVSGVGAILAYILTQRKTMVKHDKPNQEESTNEADDEA
jgi:mannose/fructose/N-acetylgalactosamine-specific phosphotransferase system component IIC